MSEDDRYITRCPGCSEIQGKVHKVRRDILNKERLDKCGCLKASFATGSTFNLTVFMSRRFQGFSKVLFFSEFKKLFETTFRPCNISMLLLERTFISHKNSNEDYIRKLNVFKVLRSKYFVMMDTVTSLITSIFINAIA